MTPFRIFNGWDGREPDARFSLERRATIPVEITPKKVEELDARCFIGEAEVLR